MAIDTAVKRRSVTDHELFCHAPSPVGIRKYRQRRQTAGFYTGLAALLGDKSYSSTILADNHNVIEFSDNHIVTNYNDNYNVIELLDNHIVINYKDNYTIAGLGG